MWEDGKKSENLREKFRKSVKTRVEIKRGNKRRNCGEVKISRRQHPREALAFRPAAYGSCFSGEGT